MRLAVEWSSSKNEGCRNWQTKTQVGAYLGALDVNDLPEFVEDGVNGLLVGLNDEKALADALGRLAIDKQLRVSLGASARQWARGNLEMKLVLDRLDGLYQRCVERRRRT